MKYIVRISEFRYGAVTVEADSEEQAKTIASGAEINWFDNEVTDMAAEPADDERIERLWAEFADVPMNPETECMEAPFLHFPAGTQREEIWHWFDERYSGGVYALLYGKKGED